MGNRLDFRCNPELNCRTKKGAMPPDTTHSTAARHRRSTLLLGSLGDHGFRSDEQPGNGRGTLERGADHLSWINDPGLQHVTCTFSVCALKPRSGKLLKVLVRQVEETELSSALLLLS